MNPLYWDYYAGGSDDEVTVRANLSDFAHLRLLPRMLEDVGRVTRPPQCWDAGPHAHSGGPLGDALHGASRGRVPRRRGEPVRRAR